MIAFHPIQIVPDDPNQLEIMNFHTTCMKASADYLPETAPVNNWCQQVISINRKECVGRKALQKKINLLKKKTNIHHFKDLGDI